MEFVFRFRADGRSLVAALRFILDELHRSRHCLFVSGALLCLPLRPKAGGLS